MAKSMVFVYFSLITFRLNLIDFKWIFHEIVTLCWSSLNVRITLYTSWIYTYMCVHVNGSGCTCSRGGQNNNNNMSCISILFTWGWYMKAWVKCLCSLQSPVMVMDAPCFCSVCLCPLDVHSPARICIPLMYLKEQKYLVWNRVRDLNRNSVFCKLYI